MRCPKAQSLISLVLDDAVDEYRRRQLSEHLAGCPDCRAHEKVLREGRSALQGAMVEPSENFEWKLALKIQKALRERAREQDERPAARAFWTPALLSAISVAIVVVGIGALTLREGTAPMTLPAGISPIPVATESTNATALDLSGAVPAPRLNVDLGGSGFGIRTVGDSGPSVASPFDRDLMSRRRSVFLPPTMRRFGTGAQGWTPVANPTLRLRFETGRLATQPESGDSAVYRR